MACSLIGTVTLLQWQCTQQRNLVVEPHRPPASKVSLDYENVIKHIIGFHCGGCHFGDHTAAGLNLEGYDNVMTSIRQDSLLFRLHDLEAPMPPGQLMPQKELELIDRWVEEGYYESADTAQ